MKRATVTARGAWSTPRDAFLDEAGSAPPAFVYAPSEVVDAPLVPRRNVALYLFLVITLALAGGLVLWAGIETVKHFAPTQGGKVGGR